MVRGGRRPISSTVVEVDADRNIFQRLGFETAAAFGKIYELKTEVEYRITSSAFSLMK